MTVKKKRKIKMYLFKEHISKYIKVSCISFKFLFSFKPASFVNVVTYFQHLGIFFCMFDIVLFHVF